MTDNDQQPPQRTALAALSRRGFVGASLVAGYTLATGPINAAAIATPVGDLVAGEVQVPVGNDRLPAYRARPQGHGPFPVVLVVQEIFGVHEHIRDVCRRFAREGYYAIATELYARQGDVSRLDNFQQILAIVSRVPDAQVMADLDATRRFAASDGGNDARVAITGFCWGGRITWLYAAHSATVRAGVAWYGRLRAAATELQPAHPLDRVANLQAPVLGLYGEQDSGIPVADVDAMRTALAAETSAAAKASSIVLYPGAPHGFHADYRDGYRAAEAKDGWAKLLAFFRRHGA